MTPTLLIDMVYQPEKWVRRRGSFCFNFVLSFCFTPTAKSSWKRSHKNRRKIFLYHEEMLRNISCFYHSIFQQSIFVSVSMYVYQVVLKSEECHFTTPYVGLASWISAAAQIALRILLQLPSRSQWLWYRKRDIPWRQRGKRKTRGKKGRKTKTKARNRTGT